MPITNTPTIEQWLLLGVFFIISAVYGFTKNAKRGGCRPCYYISFGLLFVVLNCLALFIANRAGLESFNLIELMTLRQTAIESSFIVFGYCLIIQGIAMFVKYLSLPASVKASQSYL
ncbi:MAG TPA: hypothetical protein ENI65_01690 [Gammaproteobacteria bacterium]|nr:hypothetical protein [Gammaproteobacteria bacterium]